MSPVVLQIWGGSFYLLNKFFFLYGEYNTEKRQVWRTWSWAVYLVGLPAWIILLADKNAWIVACVEASGAPGMMLGLVIALRGKGKEPSWMKYVAIIGVLVGVALSLYDYFYLGVMPWRDKILEIGVAWGFLCGTFLLANDNPKGYRWFMWMNASNALLMLTKGYEWLFVQQVISLIVVVWAYTLAKRRPQELTPAIPLC